VGRRGDVKSVDDSVCKSSKTWLKRTQRESIVLPEVTLGYAGVTEFTQSLWCEQKVVFHRLMPKDVKMETPEMARGNQLHLERGTQVDLAQVFTACAYYNLDLCNYRCVTLLPAYVHRSKYKCYVCLRY
jgi:hypothetical protein